MRLKTHTKKIVRLTNIYFNQKISGKRQSVCERERKRRIHRVIFAELFFRLKKKSKKKIDLIQSIESVVSLFSDPVIGRHGVCISSRNSINNNNNTKYRFNFANTHCGIQRPNHEKIQVKFLFLHGVGLEIAVTGLCVCLPLITHIFWITCCEHSLRAHLQWDRDQSLRSWEPFDVFNFVCICISICFPLISMHSLSFQMSYTFHRLINGTNERRARSLLVKSDMIEEGIMYFNFRRLWINAYDWPKYPFVFQLVWNFPCSPNEKHALQIHAQSPIF